MDPPSFLLDCGEISKQRWQSHLEAITKLSLARGLPESRNQIRGTTIYLSILTAIGLVNITDSFISKDGKGRAISWFQRKAIFSLDGPGKAVILRLGR